MKKAIKWIGVLLVIFLIGFIYFVKNQPDKDVYIEENFPLFKENLTVEEQQKFKESMEFNFMGKLTSFDNVLLEKGAGDQFGVYYQFIAKERTGVTNVIGLVNQDGTEIIIDTNGTILSKTNVSTKEVVDSEINGAYIKSYDDKSYKVKDLVAQDGLFIITSTGCGPCVLAYPSLNELAQSSDYIQNKFVALYRDSFQKINTYKEGSMFAKFGELKQPWVVFSSEELIRKFNSNYDFKGVPYVFIKRNGKIIYQKYEIDVNEIKKELQGI